MRPVPGAAMLLAMMASGTLAGAQPRDLCPDRPGLTTPACTVEPGSVEVEFGVGWSAMRGDGTREDDFDVGDTLVRIGATPHGEVRIGWTAAGFSRLRNLVTGETMRDSGVGDLTLSFRRNLRNPDGSGVSFAVQPTVTLPTGDGPLGAGTWGAGVLVPASFALNDKLALAVTAEGDAAPDSDGAGRHVAYEVDAGLSLAVRNRLSLGLEGEIRRDLDRAGHSTEAQTGVDIAWQPTRGTQLDLGATVGLTRASADLGIYAGATRRF